MFEDLPKWLVDIQLWSGIWGAICGAVIGGLLTLYILSITIRKAKEAADEQATIAKDAASAAARAADEQAAIAKDAATAAAASALAHLNQQAKIAEKAATDAEAAALAHLNHLEASAAARLEQQTRDAKAQLKQQAEQLANQMAAQREERREAREVEAVGDLLMFVTSLVHNLPEDLSFVPELVRTCDRLTISVNDFVGEDWRTTGKRDKLGITRHPLAEALTLRLALHQVSVIAYPMITELYGGAIPVAFRTALPQVPLTPDGIRKQLIEDLNVLSEGLLRWTSLKDVEKSAAFSTLNSETMQKAARFLVAAEYLVHGSEPFPRRVGFQREMSRAPGRITLRELPVQAALINQAWDSVGLERYNELHRRLAERFERRIAENPQARAEWDESLLRADTQSRAIRRARIDEMRESKRKRLASNGGLEKGASTLAPRVSDRDALEDPLEASDGLVKQ